MGYADRVRNHQEGDARKHGDHVMPHDRSGAGWGGWRVGATALLLAAGTGCAVIHPAGYDELVARGVPTNIDPTAFQVMGCAPWSYDLPGDQKAIVRLDTGESLMDERFSFDLSLGSVALTCSSGEPTAQLKCRGVGHQAELEFAGGDACAKLSRLDLLRSPSCWRGEVAFDQERYPFAYASLESGAAPISRVAWTDARTGEAVQSYEGIVDTLVTIRHDPERKLPQRTSELLTASALALHYWNHTLYCD